MASTHVSKEAIWLKSLLDDLGVHQKNIIVHFDRHSTLYLARNQIYHARIKNIDVQYHSS